MSQPLLSADSISGVGQMPLMWGAWYSHLSYAIEQFFRSSRYVSLVPCLLAAELFERRFISTAVFSCCKNDHNYTKKSIYPSYCVYSNVEALFIVLRNCEFQVNSCSDLTTLNKGSMDALPATNDASATRRGNNKTLLLFRDPTYSTGGNEKDIDRSRRRHLPSISRCGY